MASYARRDIRGGAAATTITAGINGSASTILIASSSGWPDGGAGDFFAVIDRGNAAEEKVRCASRSSTTLTVQTAGRGADGTNAASHSSGATIEHCGSALDQDEANYTVAETVGKITAVGQLLVADGANSLAALDNGTAGRPLVAGASSPAYGTLSSSGLATDSVTATQIAAGAVGTSELAALGVTTAKLALLSVDSTILAANAVTTAKITDLNVTTGKLAANAVTAAKIAAATVTETELAASVAGAGLAGGAGTALAVNVDDSTIAIAFDILFVKAGGVGSTQLAAGVGRGVLSSGYAAVTSDQTGIGASITDLTSLTVTVTVRASSRIRVTGYVLAQSAGGDEAVLSIRESSTVLQEAHGSPSSVGLFATLRAEAILTPSTGSHTYKLSLNRGQGVGTVDMKAASTRPAFILVEDIGA